ncbi:MAG: META domain-containing protein [Candidatus Limnocylindria bacterium]
MILALLLSGCSLLSGVGSSSLDGDWQLQAETNQGQPVPIVAGSRITMKIAGGKVSGSAACNAYGGTIKVAGSAVTITALSMTEMACQENLMASEAAYLVALPRVTTVERSGSSMVLTGPEVELSFVVIPPVADANLMGTSWLLESLINGQVASSTVATATLELSADGALVASTGCRDLTGRYTISGSVVKVTLDPYDTIGCANPIGDQDAGVLRVISTQFTFSIEGQSLTLANGDRGLGYRSAATE